MLSRLIYALIVAIVVFILSYVVLELLSFPVSPWATLLALLAGVLTFLGSDRRFLR